MRRAPRCMMEARVGALWPIEEIGPEGNKSIGLPLLLTDGGGVVNLQKEYRGKLPMEIVLENETSV